MRGDVIFVYKRLDTHFSGSASDSGCAAEEGLASYFSYKHYGIDLGDDRVAHFTGNRPEDYKIVISSRSFFAAGGPIHIDKSVNYAFTKDETAARALGMAGSDFDGYDYLSNNCEHFTTWCATGVRRSSQSEKFKTLSKAVMIAFIRFVLLRRIPMRYPISF